MFKSSSYSSKIFWDRNLMFISVTKITKIVACSFDMLPSYSTRRTASTVTNRRVIFEISYKKADFHNQLNIYILPKQNTSINQENSCLKNVIPKKTSQPSYLQYMIINYHLSSCSETSKWNWIQLYMCVCISCLTNQSTVEFLKLQL